MSTGPFPNAQTIQLPLLEPEAGNYFVAAYPPFSAWKAEQIPALKDTLAQPRSAPIGLYIHLPFCPNKCNYCYYLSYISQASNVVDRYIDAVTREAELYLKSEGIKGRSVNFAYFGGGTPSTLSSGQLTRLMNGLKRVLPWDWIEEVTYECAPRSVRDEFLSSMREAGVTRVSMGVQSFDNELLKLNGRVHLAEDVTRAFQKVRKAGFPIVNLDLMCGLVGETEEQWRDSVRKMIELGPDSVTIYQTEIPLNTQLYRDLKDGALPAATVSWDIKRERLDYGFSELERAGYSVVSAYNAVKNPQRHPFVYQDRLWGGDDMLGLGVAAFGYFAGIHYQNEVTIEKYEAAVERGDLPLKRAYALSTHDQLVREFLLQLKCGTVISQPFRDRFDVNISDVFSDHLQYLQSKGYLTFDNACVRLTRSGLLRVDRLLPLFYDPQYRESRYT